MLYWIIQLTLMMRNSCGPVVKREHGEVVRVGSIVIRLKRPLFYCMSQRVCQLKLQNAEAKPKTAELRCTAFVQSLLLSVVLRENKFLHGGGWIASRTNSC
jgi:hypothetical protein